MKKLTGIAIGLVIIISGKAQTDKSKTNLSKSLVANTTDVNMEKRTRPAEDLLFLYHLKLTSKYENPEIWNEKTQKIVDRHVEFLTQLGRDGILIMAGRTQYQPGHKYLFGIAVIKASSIEEATQLTQDDPVILEGVMYSTIHPYSIGFRYFENLDD